MKTKLILLLACSALVFPRLTLGDTTEEENAKLRDRLARAKKRTAALKTAIEAVKKEIADKRLQVARLGGTVKGTVESTAEGTPKPAPLPKRNSIATLREKISSTTWKFSRLKFGFNEDGTVGGYMRGGRWKIISSSVIKVYDRTGKYRVTFTFNEDYSQAHANWISGASGGAKRLN